MKKMMLSVHFTLYIVDEMRWPLKINFFASFISKSELDSCFLGWSLDWTNNVFKNMFSVLGPFQGGYNSIYDISYVCIYLAMCSTHFNAIACRITRHNIFYCASHFLACSYLFTWWGSGGLFIFQPAVSGDSDYFRSFFHFRFFCFILFFPPDLYTWSWLDFALK